MKEIFRDGLGKPQSVGVPGWVVPSPGTIPWSGDGVHVTGIDELTIAREETGGTTAIGLCYQYEGCFSMSWHVLGTVGGEIVRDPISCATLSREYNISVCILGLLFCVLGHIWRTEFHRDVLVQGYAYHKLNTVRARSHRVWETRPPNALTVHNVRIFGDVFFCR